MFNLTVYLRCEANHPNEVPVRDRERRVGTPCVACGRPLLAFPERERGPAAPRRRY